MSLFVNSNISSLTAQRNITNIGNSLSTSFERLSSGFRINSAADDAAGLQISDRMSSQIAGLDQAVRNANDGISVVQTADGALEEIVTIAQRMRTLVIQSRDGTNSKPDKNALQEEVDELNKEITRISNTSEFAGQNLLDGTYNENFLVGANSGQTINVDITRESGFTADALGLSKLVLDGSKSISEDSVEGIQNSLGTTFTLPNPPQLGTITGLQFSLNGGEYRYINEPFSNPYSIGHTPGQITFGADTSINMIMLGLSIRLVDNSFQASIDNVNNSFTTTNVESLSFRLAGEVNNLETAKANQILAASLTGLSPEQVGLQGYPIIPPEDEERASIYNLAVIDSAISTINGYRADLGALQNRFQSTLRNLSNISENVSAARSQIRDTDYALETANLTRNQIIQQASVSVLAQANNRPQAALSLLS
ncbi:flagellin N-terminal helical domain-containing protein [Planctobacterium marinum]|uniref:flagellin N-terminal helical domain-containing protein n=1 Tax=Planctobacterium marinum TaxID=1631968 RepID=UPI001E34C261|nr:flagellin [Planctobacterium marinum]MCC2606800.1 flagellin [Planctobacterium marinum]